VFGRKHQSIRTLIRRDVAPTTDAHTREGWQREPCDG
jgi:hypothetical protein